MKGIVFTEFLEMVEEKFGMEVADHIVTQSDLPSQGIYTAVGTYDHQEMMSLVTNLSQTSGLSISDLLRVYGQHLFGRFSQLYGRFFQEIPDAFSFLGRIEDYIHVEVKKLYPDAELPQFAIKYLAPDRLQMIYQSKRGMADFAEGLIQGCIDHFQEKIQISREPLGEGNHKVKFILTRQAA
ncbi:MAG: heme NO-binding domain-containing protein [Bacteroidota bacterium]